MPLASRGQHDRAGADGRQIAVLVAGLLFDRDEPAAVVVGGLVGDPSGDENPVPGDVVVADLRLVAEQEPVVADPVREVMGEPGAPLGAVVVGAWGADGGGELLLPMDPLGDVGDPEAVG